MFERFSEQARQVVVGAQEEARLLGHAEIGDDHLLLGIALAAPELVGVPLGALRARVVASRGQGEGSPEGMMPFSAEAKRALDLGLEASLRENAPKVGVEDLLSGIVEIDARAADVLARLGVDSLGGGEVTGRNATVPRDRGDADVPGPSPDDVERTLAGGDPVPASLAGSPIGDVGNRVTDVRLLLAILAADGSGAALLRNHGIDEAAVRAAAPELD